MENLRISKNCLEVVFGCLGFLPSAKISFITKAGAGRRYHVSFFLLVITVCNF